MRRFRLQCAELDAGSTMRLCLTNCMARVAQSNNRHSFNKSPAACRTDLNPCQRDGGANQATLALQ